MSGSIPCPAPAGPVRPVRKRHFRYVTALLLVAALMSGTGVSATAEPAATPAHPAEMGANSQTQIAQPKPEDDLLKPGDDLLKGGDYLLKVGDDLLRGDVKTDTEEKKQEDVG